MEGVAQYRGSGYINSFFIQIYKKIPKKLKIYKKIQFHQTKINFLHIFLVLLTFFKCIIILATIMEILITQWEWLRPIDVIYRTKLLAKSTLSDFLPDSGVTYVPYVQSIFLESSNGHWFINIFAYCFLDLNKILYNSTFTTQVK